MHVTCIPLYHMPKSDSDQTRVQPSSATHTCTPAQVLSSILRRRSDPVPALSNPRPLDSETACAYFATSQTYMSSARELDYSCCILQETQTQRILYCEELLVRVYLSGVHSADPEQQDHFALLQVQRILEKASKSTLYSPKELCRVLHDTGVGPLNRELNA